MTGLPTGFARSTTVIKKVLGTDPAANAEVSETVPTGKIWELLAVSVSLVQGATQTPQPTLIIDDGTDIVFQGFGGSSAQNASVTARYSWAKDLPLSAAGALTVVTAPLPSGLILQAGWRIRTSTIGIGANSNYGAPTLFVVEHS